MNKNTNWTMRSYETVSCSGLVAEVKLCPRCQRPLFHRVEVRGKKLFVHGDRSFCYAWRDE